MNQVTRLPTAAEIEEEAATWVWRLDGEGATAEQRREFEVWLRRDARHRKAFADLGGVWNTLDALADAKREEKIALFTNPQSPLSGESHDDRSFTTLRRRLLPWSIAALVLLSIGTFAWLKRATETQTLATAVGQQRTVPLADGSTVYLNTNTILEVRLSPEQRRIQLVKGEALFKVARDRERPFLVQAGGTVVRAIGTEFNVRMREANDIEVVVAEGRVEVESRADTAAAPSARIKHALNAGERWEARKIMPIVPIDAAAVAKTIAWREGAIVFDGEPLSEAIAELNRYSDTRFVATDPRVRDLKVGGRFKAGDSAEVLAALRKALPVTTRRTPDNIVYIEFRRD